MSTHPREKKVNRKKKRGKKRNFNQPISFAAMLKGSAHILLGPKNQFHLNEH